MKPSPFTFCKSFDHGTSNPIVARTYYQSQRLLSLYSFGKEFENQNAKVMFEIEQRLLDCYDRSSSMINEIESDKLTFHEKTNNDPSFRPHIMKLDTRLESFFQSAKLSLHYIADIFKLFFGKDFGHHYHKALKWTEGQFGADDHLTKTLNRHSKQIEKIIAVRNAIEHPKDKLHGRFNIKNFCVTRINSKVELSEPLWWLTGDDPDTVSEVLPVIVDSLLRLSEELYVASLIKQKTLITVGIEDIPEENRDKSAPMRFRAVDYSFKSKK